ncbi:hypothetical protein SAMN05421743_10566 [Thalassobacillus cyri]|uniref:Uncharacterized protein n=1 Tax=Thalassobacillus cyri TaxID=571932 RepID=A0A1H4BKB1_9BACI|nr:hypothetical protein [Thalassobacillus cyri]SEA48635.1 hypothetical protein SAMN05421743_10566 [Thalassobacillus cyri]
MDKDQQKSPKVEEDSLEGINESYQSGSVEFPRMKEKKNKREE